MHIIPSALFFLCCPLQGQTRMAYLAFATGQIARLKAGDLFIFTMPKAPRTSMKEGVEVLSHREVRSLWSWAGS